MSEVLDRLQSALADRYTIQRELGRGGMAIVYLAEDLRHERRVAIKVLRPELTSAVAGERFLREIKLTARLNHPHILPLLDSGEADGVVYYVMPYVDEESLRARLQREGALPVEEALRITLDCAGGLAYAHEHGVLHRDIKPANVLLSSNRAVLADFGIARALEKAAEPEALTGTGVSVGTVGYMSPEQATGERNLDARSDVYALGCVLYEMLAGEPAFRGATAQAVLARQITEGPPSVSVVRPNVPRSVEVVIKRALEPNPADRFRSIREFTEALQLPSIKVAEMRARLAWRNVKRLGVALFALLGSVVIGYAGMRFLGIEPFGSARLNEEGRASAPSLTAQRLGPRSVAVLPFHTASADTEKVEYFADGMLGEILTQLHKIEDLVAIGRASVIHYRGSAKPAGAIGEELGVAAVLAGNLIKAGDRIRLDVELLETRTGRALWAASYDRPLTVERLFEIQTDIAIQIANALEATLSPAELLRLADRPTTNEDAYNHYLRGEGYFQDFLVDEAISAYERAVEADPEFATAWAALAKARALSYWSPHSYVVTREETEEALERAQELAPEAAETHLAEGLLKMYASAAYDEAIESFSQALELRPGAIEPLVFTGIAHAFPLRLEEARKFAERAVALDPANVMAVWQLGFIHAEQWRFDDAKRYFDRAIALAPEGPIYFGQRWGLYMWGLGDTAAARQLLDDAPSDDSFELDRVTSSTLEKRAWLAYVNRDTRRLDQLLQRMNGFSVARYEWLARFHRLEGDTELQRLYGDSMRLAAEADLKAAIEGDDRPVHVEWHRSKLAVALALAGEEAEALRTIQLAVERVSAQPDRLNAVLVHHNEIRTYAFLGRTQTAIDRLNSLSRDRRERNLTPGRLRLDPDFDPLRDHPGFQTLVNRYE